jgi:UDP-2,3-diacylglucosamine pyrophosphatase LpxH
MQNIKKYRSIFISDVHLGARMSQANLLLDFLKMKAMSLKFA